MELSIVAENQGALLKVKYAFDLDCWLFFFGGGDEGGSIAKKESHMYIHETKNSLLHNIKTSSFRFCVISDKIFTKFYPQTKKSFRENHI